MQPFQQGELDRLCGIYVLINSIRLATAASTRDFTEEAWRELFFTLLLRADELLGTGTVIASGIRAKPLRNVALAAIEHLAARGIKITIRRAILADESQSFDGLVDRLTALTAEPRSAVLIRLRGDVDHRTVLRAVRQGSLELFDSSGRKRVRLTSCRTREEWSHAPARDYVIRPNRIFHIRN